MVRGGRRKKGFPFGSRAYAPHLPPEHGRSSGPPDSGGFLTGPPGDSDYGLLCRERYGPMRTSSEQSERGHGPGNRGFQHVMESGFGSMTAMEKDFRTLDNRDMGLPSPYWLGESNTFIDGRRGARQWPNEGLSFGRDAEPPQIQPLARRHAAEPPLGTQAEGRIPEGSLTTSLEPTAPMKQGPSPSIAKKPPPGRYEGIISFVGNNYGIIERADLQRISFSFQAFWGDSTYMIPGVKVQFTVLKEKGQECATDVVVAPGGMEEVHSQVFEGVVTRAPWECQTDEKRAIGSLGHHLGCLQAQLFGSEVVLPFGEGDSMVTLLPGDRVHFHLFIDLLTKRKRAGNIEPVPETFRFTAETRQTGTVMSSTGSSGSIMSDCLGSIVFENKESLGGDELNTADKVEFTVFPLRSSEKQKAIRVRKLPWDRPVLVSEANKNTTEPKDRIKAPEEQGTKTSRSAWWGKPDTRASEWKTSPSIVLPQRTVVFEDVSPEQYNGTVLMPILKDPQTLQVNLRSGSRPNPSTGHLLATLAGEEKKFPFGLSDVLSEATMLEGDKVQFNVSINRGTKAERAVNVEILPDTFQHTNELREMGVVVDLRESSGFISCDRDPQMFFHLSEVMEESKLNVSDIVAFTVIPKTSMEGYQAVRIKKFHERVSTSTPKMEDRSTAPRDKNKIMVKVLRDSANNEMETLKVKIESFDNDILDDDLEDDKSSEVDYGAGKAVGLDSKLQKVESPLQLEKAKVELGAAQPAVEVKTGDSLAAAYTDKARIIEGECEQLGSSAEAGLCVGKLWSPNRDQDWRSSHNHSQSRMQVSEKYNHCKRSGDGRRKWNRSQSRERIIHISQRRDRSHSHSHSRDRIICISERWKDRWSRERDSDPARGRSRSPRNENRSHDHSTADGTNSAFSPKGQESAGVAVELNEKLFKKKRQLELLEEQVARRRAIMAMELKSRSLTAHYKSEEDRDIRTDELPGSGCDDCRLPMKPNNSVSHKNDSAPLPVKSILKKPAQRSVEPDIQPKNDLTDTLSPNQDLDTEYGFEDRPIQCLLPARQTSDFKLDFDQSSVSQFGLLQTSCPSAFDKHHLDHSLSHTLPSEQTSDHHQCPHPFPHSSVELSPSVEPPPCNPLPDQQPQNSTKDKSNLSIQIERFLNTLNKGVDANLLRSLIREAREATAEYDRWSLQQVPQQELLSKGQLQYQSLYEKKAGTSEDRGGDVLLPQKKAAVDGGGFSHSKRLTREPWEQDECGRATVREGEEPYFLYGETSLENEHSCENPKDANSLLPVCGEEKVEDKTHFQKIQSLLQTIGLDLDTAEVSKLADRTQERLYGKKQKQRLLGPSKSDSRVSLTEQQDSTVMSFNWKVCGTHPETTECSGTQGDITPTILANQASGILSVPSSSQYAQGTVETAYGVVQPNLGYSHHKTAARSVWEPVPHQSEADCHLPYPQHQHPDHLPPPMTQPPLLLTFSVGNVESILPTPHIPVMPSAALMGPHPELLSAISGQHLFSSYYPTNLLARLPLYPYQSQGGSSLASTQPQLGGKASREKRSTLQREPLKSRCLRVIETVQVKQQSQKDNPMTPKEMTQTPHVPGFTSSLPSLTSATTEKKQAAKISEDDIKAKQMKRLEQFKERMRLKREQRVEAQGTCVERQKSPAGKTCKEVKNVWICGHSLVFWAEKRAKVPSYDMPLGMDPGRVHLWWKGTQGMKWEQLLPLLLQLKDTWPNPDVVIIHLGGNDLGSGDPEKFLDAMRKDLESMKNIFPQCLLVWSSILPRRSWGSFEDVEAVERVRVMVNEKVRENIHRLGGMAVDHEQIRPGSDSGLYRPDGIHLSGKGIDRFNMNIQDFLEKWEHEMSQPLKCLA